MRRNRRSRVSGKVDTSPESSQTQCRTAALRGRPRPLGKVADGDHAARPVDAGRFSASTTRSTKPLRRAGTSSTSGRSRRTGSSRRTARSRSSRSPSSADEEPQNSRKERQFGLKALAGFVTVPRMATTEAPGFAARARQRQREEARAKARRARRTAALVVVACGCLVALLLTAFGRGGESAVTVTGPAPASRLLPAGPPRPQIVATQDSLQHPAPDRPEPGDRARLPRQRDAGALPSSPWARRRTRASPSGSSAGSSVRPARSVRYYMLEGGVGRRDRRPRRRRAGRHRRLRARRRHASSPSPTTS